MKNVIIFAAALAALAVVGTGFAFRLGEGSNGGQGGFGRRPSFPNFMEAGGRTETVRKLESFDSISMPGSGTLRIRMGTEPSVVVRADGRVMERVDTTVRGDELVLSVRGPQFGSSVEYEVTTPSLRSLRVTGSGDVITTDTLVGKDLRIDILGSGSVEARVDMDAISVGIKGSGDVKLGGTADEADLEIFGSGDLDAGDLNGGRASVSVMGSGDTDLGVFEELNAKVMGSGDVKYEGTPRLSASTPGSGEVSRR